MREGIANGIITNILNISFNIIIINIMRYEELLQSFVDGFIRNFGELKFKKIHEKIENSKGVTKTLVKLNELNTHPGSEDIVATVMNMPYFMFGKKEMVAMGSIIFLEKWNTTSNTNHKYLDDYELYGLFNRVLKQCGSML